MKPRISMITLGVGDLQRAIHFYETGLQLPRMPMPAEADVAFFTLNGSWLGLYPRSNLAGDMDMAPEGSGFAGFTLAHNLDSREAVDAQMEQALNAGATLVKAAHDTEWGGYCGYFTDPDGYVWEIAWNPHFWVGPQDA